MVLAFYAHPDAREKVRGLLGYPTAGLTADQIKTAARACGLDAEGFEVSVDDIDMLPTPAILHWRGGHYVVLEGTTRGLFEIVDPTSGRRRLTRDQMAQRFSGVALAFEAVGTTGHPTAQSRARREREPLVAWSRREAKLLTLLVGALVMEGVGYLVAAKSGALWMAAWLSSDVGQAQDAAVAIVGLVLAGAAHATAQALNLRATKGLGEHLTTYFAASVGQADPEYLTTRTDRYLEHLAGDIDPTVNASFPAPSRLLRGTVGALLLVAAIPYSPPSAAGLALVIGALMVLMARSDGPATKNEDRSVGRVHAAREASRAVLARVETLLTSGSLNAALALWLDLRRTADRGDARAEVRAPASYPTLVALCVGVTWLALMSEHLTGTLPLADTLTLQVFATIAIVSFSASTTEFGKLTKWRDSLVRLRELRAEMRAPPTGAPVQQTSGDGRDDLPADRNVSALPTPVLEVHALGYRPTSDQVDVIRDVSLTIARGEAIAIVGGAGAGKTTLARLLLGLRQPSRGRILVRGRDVAALTESERRTLVGGLLESAEPVGGTILTGFQLRDGAVDPTRLIQACALVGIDQWIETLPLRENTPIARGGVFGERQRQLLCLAALLLEPPELLVLDSTLDALDGHHASALARSLAALPSAIVLCTRRPNILSSGYRRYDFTQGRLKSIQSDAAMRASLT